MRELGSGSRLEPAVGEEAPGSLERGRIEAHEFHPSGAGPQAMRGPAVPNGRVGCPVAAAGQPAVAYGATSEAASCPSASIAASHVSVTGSVSAIISARTAGSTSITVTSPACA